MEKVCTKSGWGEGSGPAVFPIREEDIPFCREIYNYYIRETTVTFEEQELTAEQFARRVRRISAGYPYLVAREGERVLGYAYLDLYSERSAYRFTADLSIYLDKSCRARGIGRLLWAAVEKEAESRGFRQVISLVTGENAGSRAFHERCGFVHRGRLEAVGCKFGRWLDVDFYQKTVGEPGGEA